MNAQEMIEAYVRTVGQHLPAKNREDIQREIRTLIEDTLEDRAGGQGKSPDEEMTAAVLKELGSPEKMAASYQPPRFLIGPNLFPHYLTTLRIAIPVLLVLVALSLGISLGATSPGGQGLAQGLLQAFSSLVDVVFRAFGVITIIFAILQWTQPDLATKEKNWDPRMLKLSPAPERIKYSDHIAEIIGGIIAIVLFNIYPQWVGFFFQKNGEWLHATVLSQAFFQYLPFLTVLWALQIGLNGAILAQGKWTSLSRWGKVALDAANVVLLAVMLSGPALTSIDPTALARLGWSFPSNVPLLSLSNVLETGVRLALGITVVVKVIQIGANLYRLLLRDHLEAAGLVA